MPYLFKNNRKVRYLINDYQSCPIEEKEDIYKPIKFIILRNQ